MNVDIITFHDTSNFGATLQCAALSSHLARLGHHVRVVDYLPAFVRAKKRAFKPFDNRKRRVSPPKAALKALAALAFVPARSRRNAAFRSFIEAKIPLTRAYLSAEELLEDPPRSDLAICGSDQVWNPALTGGKLDPAFFLHFATARKAAYGVSLGELDVDAHAGELRRLTCGFSALSVREKSSALKLSGILQRDVDVVLDPTLLLSRNDYAPFESSRPPCPSPYLLVYNVQNSPLAVSTARSLAKRLHLDIVDISPNPFARIPGAQKLIGIGPGEFLGAVKNASFVVTNSFHGTVFSVIYGKPFLSVPHSKRGGRTIELLRTLGLSDRLLHEEVPAVPPPEIDYARVLAALEQPRSSSAAFLQGLLDS